MDRAAADPAAFAALYRRHYGAVAGYLFRRTGDRHVTEELLSEVFVAAWRGLGRYRSRGAPFRCWLYGIASRRVNRWVQRRRRREEPCGDLPHVPDPRRAAAAAAEASDEAARLLALVLALRPAQQTVLALYYFEGLGIGAIAAALGVRPGTVKSRLDRARRQLKELLVDPR